MHKSIFVLSNNIASIGCVFFAGLLCLKESPYWGWFLFAALVMHTAYVWKEKSGDEDKSVPEAK